VAILTGLPVFSHPDMSTSTHCVKLRTHT